MNMETTTVKKQRGHFLVSNIEDLCIKVSVNQVNAITQELPELEENEVAILLATIKASRIITSKGANKYEKIEPELGVAAIVEILKSYDVDNLNSIFEELRYYEIKNVIESINPVEALRTLV